MYKIIEEVPGVPSDERYYVSGPSLKYPHPTFATSQIAKDWCDKEGNTPYEIVPFEP